MNFLIVVTGWNCQQYVKPCYDSLLRQTYGNFTAVFISDGSTDNTAAEIRQHVQDKRFIIESHPDNTGAAKRRYDVIHRYGKPTDIVLLLGMDDELLPNCLERVKQEYDRGMYMTYGNWINQKGEGLPKTFRLHFDDETHRHRLYRKVEYRSTAPNTFYKFLFDLIPESDFKIKGKWIDSTTESETMFSCLEMCGRERIGVILEKIYLYNQNLPNGTLKRQGKEYKYKIYNQIIQRPRKPLLPLNYIDTMKTTETKWNAAAQALIDRRKTGVQDNAKCEPLIADYGRHLRAVKVGDSVLDVGAGDGNLRNILEKHTQYGGKQHQYIGIDAFPANEGIIKGTSEALPFEDHTIETVVCFAVLDGTLDAAKSIAEMCRVASKNVVLLTGIGIEPDKYHTHKIEDAWLHEQFKQNGFKCNMSNYLEPQVLLIEFVPVVARLTALPKSERIEIYTAGIELPENAALESALSRQASEIDRQLSVQQDRFNQGLTNSLAFQEAEKAKSLERQAALDKQAQKQEEAQQLANLFLDLFSEYVKEGDINAAGKALAQTFVAKGISNAIAGTALEGTEDTGKADGKGLECVRFQLYATAFNADGQQGFVLVVGEVGVIAVR